MKFQLITFISATFILTNVSCKREKIEAREPVEVITATGDITDEVQHFKNELGTLNTTPGASGGHREINWDGVPDSLLDKPLPDNFFNQTGPGKSASLQRGLNYSRGNFVVSSNGFEAINRNASSEFSPFSGTRTFANISAVMWDVSFQKPGSIAKASVQAFGLVFSDVDRENSTSVEFFDGETSLGKYFLPAHDATSSFSFLAIKFNDDRRITKITVNHDGFLSEGTEDVSTGGQGILWCWMILFIASLCSNKRV